MYLRARGQKRAHPGTQGNAVRCTLRFGAGYVAGGNTGMPGPPLCFMRQYAVYKVVQYGPCMSYARRGSATYFLRHEVSDFHDSCFGDVLSIEQAIVAVDLGYFRFPLLEKYIITMCNDRIHIRAAPINQ